MLARPKAEPDYRGCIINTASMAGMLNAPTMGVYNVSKHAVVSLTETLYQDLKLVSDQVTASVLCPVFHCDGYRAVSSQPSGGAEERRRSPRCRNWLPRHKPARR